MVSWVGIPYYKSNLTAKPKWEGPGVFGMHVLFSSVGMTVNRIANAPPQYYGQKRVDFQRWIQTITCCGAKWINCTIRRICWLVSQTEACFVHNIPCQACHRLCHFSGHRARKAKKEGKKRVQVRSDMTGMVHHLEPDSAQKWTNIHIEWILDECIT